MRRDPRGRSIRAPGLPAARRALDRWRRSAGRSRNIPPELWAGARELAHEHGVARTARALGLDYYALAKRVQATERGDGSDAARTFVELRMAAGTTPSREPRCRLELRDGGGTQLCVELRSAEPREIEALARGLWRAAR